MKKIMEQKNELSLLKEVSLLVSNIGNVELVYLTAELAPFSNQQKPDLVIHSTNNKNEALFVEYKIAPETGFKESFWIGFNEKKVFAQECSEIAIIYIFATNIKLQGHIKSELESHNIVVFDEVSDAEILSSKIKMCYNANR